MDFQRGLYFSTEELREAARAMAALGEHAQAARLYQRVLDVDPDDIEVAMRVAYHFVHGGQPRSAAPVYAQIAALAASRGSKPRSLVLARRAFECDRDRCTAARLQPWARQVGAAASSILCEIADHHRGQGTTEIARDLLRLAVDLDPSRVAACKRLVDLELTLGDRDAARDRLDAAGRMLLARGRMSEFVAVAERVLALVPTHAFFLRALADAYMRMGRARDAIPLLLALVRAEPGNPSPLVTLAELHTGLRQRKAALGALARWVWILHRRSGEAARPEIERVLDAAQRWWPGDERFLEGLVELGLFGPEPDYESEEIVLLQPPPPPPTARVA